MLRDVSLGTWFPTENRQFNIAGELFLESQCIAYLYLKHFERFDAGPFQKANIVLCQPGKRPPTSEIDVALDVVRIYRDFDFPLYFALPLAERKKLALKELHEGLLVLARHFKWPTTLLLVAD